MINSEVPPKTDPLAFENKLIMAPGFLSGTSLVNSSRLSIGAKSPLTGGIKESNVGGTVAADLANLGITAVIVEGKATEGEYYLLKIDANGDTELVDGREYKGMRTYELVTKLKEKFGDKNSVTCIGPAGDLQLTAASIQTTDADGRPCRAAGRGGLGAVMGSKGLKAVIVARGAKSSAPYANPETFKEAAKIYAKAVNDDEFTEALAQLGTAILVAPINEAGAFPTCNARKGNFEGV
jgi:aldehyde:ferredoxin oxidoreductase